MAIEEKVNHNSLVLERLSFGTHFCYLYDNKSDLLDVLVSFFKSGLENNECCIWVISVDLSKKEVVESLRKEVKNLDSYLSKNQLNLFEYDEWYKESSTFIAKDVINGWLKNLKDALKKGFKGLRITGDVKLLDMEELESFVEYEIQMNSVFETEKIIAICTYPVGIYNKFQLLDIASSHQFVLTKTSGDLKIINNASRNLAIKETEIIKDRLQKLQNLENLGLLSQGLIHDFNNFLAIIKGNAELAQINLESGENISRFLQEICDSVTNASEIIREISEFGVSNGTKKKTTDVNKSITRLMELLRPTLSSNIKIEKDLSSSLNKIEINSRKLAQILINLVQNARDAMPDGGTITIKTKNHLIANNLELERFSLKAGKYITISIKDTGIGMDKEIQKRLFDPFFTTKGSENGTGLGLPMVEHYIIESNGAITVKSQLYEGSRFTIYLPASEK
ncbi:MAG TPA: hypothetical protein ENI29_04215 [bacterium]|nr:hypothetical protein [bacterium]